jgi:two-component system response regulator YesN
LEENDEDVEEYNKIKEEYSKYESFRIALISEVDIHGRKIKLEELVKEYLKGHGDVDVIKIDEGILLLFKDFNNKRIGSTSSELKKKLEKLYIRIYL